MSNQPRIPDAEIRARSVSRLREVVQRMDRNIAELDEFIARLETENNRNLEAARQRGNAQRKAAQ
ncbi:hypothetical protein IQ264_02655 [Phormidium sp. LEGE 05292]|uniref:hypothetical protein n=1 Tax=[Phormidium] sp. LEGE 05292 TaxID=767427 RepID=UPI00187ED054|nr:hypothetical protein [Phormidium sp. LEGE 05292]MBE9224374.1 hypothetical protein [Phormidium sp. LEGE 05292]